MAMIGYKKIIENMVEMEVENFIEKKTEGKQFAYTVDDSLKLSTEDKNFGHPCFELKVSVSYRTYEVHGYVSEFGSVIISSVNFDRDYVKDQNRADWFSKDNIKHVHEFLYGDKLNEFKFDR